MAFDLRPGGEAGGAGGGRLRFPGADPLWWAGAASLFLGGMYATMSRTETALQMLVLGAAMIGLDARLPREGGPCRCDPTKEEEG